MAKAKKNTKQTNKADDNATASDSQPEDIQVEASADDSPSTVDAAYWEEKVKTAVPTPSTDKDGKTRAIEEYVSNIMVVAKPNESSEQLLRRFNRQVRELNLMDEIRDRMEYEKPSQRRKKEKRERAMKKHRWN